MTTAIKIIERMDPKQAEEEVNKCLGEFETLGYDVQVLPLTAQNINKDIPWRFVLLFTKPMYPLQPPVE